MLLLSLQVSWIIFIKKFEERKRRNQKSEKKSYKKRSPGQLNDQQWNALEKQSKNQGQLKARPSVFLRKKALVIKDPRKPLNE